MTSPMGFITVEHIFILRCPGQTRVIYRKAQVHSHVSDNGVPCHGSHMGALWVDSQASCTLAPQLTVCQSYPNPTYPEHALPLTSKEGCQACPWLPAWVC